MLQELYDITNERLAESQEHGVLAFVGGGCSSDPVFGNHDCPMEYEPPATATDRRLLRCVCPCHDEEPKRRTLVRRTRRVVRRRG